MEGVSYEAASLAGHLGLGRLVYFYDDNHITIDGTTALSFTTEDKVKRFEAQGWHVQSVEDSEDVAALERATRAAQAEEERPSLVIVRSHIAYGAPNAIDTSKSHGAPLGEDEVRAAKQTLGLDPDQHVRRRRRGRTSTWTCGLPGSRPSRSGTTASSSGPRRFRSCARSGRRTAPASRGPAGSRRCRSSRPGRGWPPATPARR